MNSLEAAHEILDNAGEPLHYEEITERMLERGLWETDGETPEATVNSRLAVDIKENGENSAFQRTQPGVFALRAWGLPEHVTSRARRRGSGSTFTFTDAAEKVLEDLADGEPMHYREITEAALSKGWLTTEGKTPEATMYASIIEENKRLEKRGEQPRFVQHGQGMVGLTDWLPTGLRRDVEQANAEVRLELRERLREMDSYDFEKLVTRLLTAMGFVDVELTPASGDGGIDVRGVLVSGGSIDQKLAVQVKRWKKNVRAPQVRNVRGSLGAHEQGLIITTSGFSKGALEEAERADATPIGLIDGEEFVKLLIEHDIGVERRTYEVLEIDEDGWELDDE